MLLLPKHAHMDWEFQGILKLIISFMLKHIFKSSTFYYASTWLPSFKLSKRLLVLIFMPVLWKHEISFKIKNQNILNVSTATKRFVFFDDFFICKVWCFQSWVGGLREKRQNEVLRGNGKMNVSLKEVMAKQIYLYVYLSLFFSITGYSWVLLSMSTLLRTINFTGWLSLWWKLVIGNFHLRDCLFEVRNLAKERGFSWVRSFSSQLAYMLKYICFFHIFIEFLFEFQIINKHTLLGFISWIILFYGIITKAHRAKLNHNQV